MSIVKQRGAEERLVRPEQGRREVLVSRVAKIASIDPLSFFAAGFKHYKGSRFFWADPVMDRVFVGLGTACEIEAHGDNRFAEVEQEWEKLLETCETQPDSEVKGTGPMLFGGFSFDPAAKKTPLWHSFPDAAFVVPIFLLTVEDGECWLTVNHMADAGRQMEHPEKWLEKERERLLSEVRGTAAWPEYDARIDIPSYSLTDVEPEAWKRAVAETARQIRDGVVDKVALAREIRVDLSARVDVSLTLKRLCAQQKESYVFAFERGNDCFLGASPERLVKRDGDKFYSTCLASSIGRGRTEKEDIRLGELLLNDDKFMIEHKVVVDMIKSVMEACCEEVGVPSEPSLFKTEYIQHLFTPVTGVARQGTTLLPMVKRLHPTPALGGYPQEQAVKKIREMEKLDRGWYAAPVGWVDRNDNGEFIGAIRSGIIRGQQASLFVGNGIVGDSDPESEFEETKLKPRPM